MKQHLLRPVHVLLVLTAGLLLLASPSEAANIVVINNDDPGEGFNDPSFWASDGGNPATTLGQARLNAFQYAADRWGEIIQSTVTIEIRAQMDPLFCTIGSATLGSAGALTIHRFVPGADLPSAWYPQALANAISGQDLSAVFPDINATFNSDLDDDPNCLLGASWYYGFDENPPGNDFDFVTVVMHEIGHGLGFQTFMDLTTGEKNQDADDSYMVHLERAGVTPGMYPLMTNNERAAANTSDPDLRWRGPNVTYIVNNDPPFAGTNGNYIRMHAPSQLAVGSSVAHFSTAVTPNEVMEPIYTVPDHDPGLAKPLMADIGWNLDPAVPVAFPGIVAVEKGAAVELLWEYEGAGAVRGFRIYRKDGQHAPERPLQGEELLDLTRRSYLDFDVAPGKSYEYTVAAVHMDGSEVISPSARAELSVRRTALAQNQPNPFNPKTTISYRVSEAGPVRLMIFDMKGRAVRTLVNTTQEPGEYDVTWDGRDAENRVAAAGTYFYRLDTEDAQLVKRMVLLK